MKGRNVLDIRNNLDSSLGGQLAKGLEGQRVADSRDIGKRLEDIRIADRVTVVEENHRRHDRLTGDDSRDGVRLRVRDVGRESSSSLYIVSTHTRPAGSSKI